MPLDRKKPCLRLCCHHHHFIARQGAGLVGADYRNGTQRLDRGQMTNDGIAARHGPDTDRKGDGHHGRKSFRNRGDGQADDIHENLVEGQLADEVAIGQQDRSNQQDQNGEPSGEDVHLRDQRGGQRLHPRNQSADPADFGIFCRGDSNAAARPVGHQRAAVGHAGPVADRSRAG